MYQQYYGFGERPFSLLPDPDFLYLSAGHTAALDTLELAVLNHSGFCVVSGEIGAGKTTLIRELLNRLDSRIRVGLVSNTHPSFGDLLQWVSAAFGLPIDAADTPELHKRFVDFLIGEYARNRHTLLIVDEAQNLTVAALEELRMLSNINSDKDFVLQVLLVGQPQLREKLHDPRLGQFAQRVALDYHLGALNADETARYIRHRLTRAGGDPLLFSDAACRSVAHHSGGIPRLVNRLCDLALVYAFSEQSRRVGSAQVEQVVADGHLGALGAPRSMPSLQPQQVAAPQAAGVPPDDGDRSAGAAAAPEPTAAVPPAAVPRVESRPATPPERELPPELLPRRSAADEAPQLQPAVDDRMPTDGDRDSEVAPLPGTTKQSRRGARMVAWVLVLLLGTGAVTAAWVSFDRWSAPAAASLRQLVEFTGEKAQQLRRALVRAAPASTPPQTRPQALQRPPLAAPAPVGPAGPAETAAVAVPTPLPPPPPDASALQRESDRVAKLKAQAEQVERERKAAEQRLARQKAARQAAEEQARRERQRLEAARAKARQAAEARARSERSLQQAESRAGVSSAPLPSAAAVQPASSPQPEPAVATPQRAKSSSVMAGENRTDTAGAASDADVRFVANPCQGPSARFLSTCR